MLSMNVNVLELAIHGTCVGLAYRFLYCLSQSAELTLCIQYAVHINL